VSEAGVERRLTTILAADVVGYSWLMAADEAATLAELKIHRKELIEPKTTEYRGRVVKLMGDGTLMEFTSVVDAVRFAIDMQRTIAEHNAGVAEDRRITYRIGINIGDIIVDGDDLYGDGVNVASRLEKLAEPREICVSGTGRRPLPRRALPGRGPAGPEGHPAATRLHRRLSHPVRQLGADRRDRGDPGHDREIA